MQAVITFVKDWYSEAADPLRRADPLLMGAAIAYNTLFAVVPLALAFVSALTLFDKTQDVLKNLYELMNEALPPDIAAFLGQILRDSVEAVENNRAVIIVVTVLVALWSGSRAVYAVQKALRLVEDPDIDPGYVRMRGTGILVTVGAGLAVIVAYTLLTIGGRISEAASNSIPGYSGSFGPIVLTAVALGWVFLLLFVLYRWGAPAPLRRPAMTAALVTVVLSAGTWVAFNLLPSQASASVAVFGTLGVVLLWLYAVGTLIVGVPIVFGALLRVLDGDTSQ